VVLTNLNPRPHTNIRKRTQRILRRVATELLNRLRRVLALAHGLDVRRVRVYGAEEAARGRGGGGEGGEREERCGEEGAAEHCCGWLAGLVGALGELMDWLVRSVCVKECIWTSQKSDKECKERRKD
jgi:hypothetical protein